MERISQLDTKSPVTKINGKRPADCRAVSFDIIRVRNLPVWENLTYVIISIPSPPPCPPYFFFSNPLLG